MKEVKPRIIALLLTGLTIGMAPQALAQGNPKPPVAPAALATLFGEAEKAYAAGDYHTVAGKLTELLELCDDKPGYPIEFLMFNLGTAQLLDGKPAEAEKTFAECARKFPKGEYASRCQLGLGKAALAQGGEAKRKLAGELLEQAAQDPKYRAEAAAPLLEFYFDTKKEEKAREMLHTSMSAEVRTAEQTSLAVEIVAVLASSGRVEDLTDYLAYLAKQPGVKDAIAWYNNQIVVKADARMDAGGWEAALAIYKAVPPRAQILEIQRAGLAAQRKELEALKLRENPPKPGVGNGNAISAAEHTLAANEKALASFVELEDFDASLLQRRGRCHYYLRRLKEASECFATIREKYPEATVAENAAYSEIMTCGELEDEAKVLELADAFTAKYPRSLNLPRVIELKEKAGK